MHESSLGKQVLGAVLSKAEEAGATRVRVVRGWIAETEHLDPSAIAFHFEVLAQGTTAEGASLELDLRWVKAKCAACGETYAPDHHVLLCPTCGNTEAEVLGQTGLGIDTIEIDTA